MFEVPNIKNRSSRLQQVYPFNTASVFARPDGKGSYDQIVFCNQHSRHGWCWVTEPYESIEGTLQVWFGGPHLAENVDTIIATARKMYADRLIAETDRVPGWGIKPRPHYRE